MSKSANRKKDITEKNLENMGLYYLERYSTSVAHFRRVMIQKIRRRCKRLEITWSDVFLERLETVITKFEKYGYLNDEAYITAIIKSGHNKGQSVRKIKSRLMQKGVDAYIIDAAIADFAEEIDPDRSLDMDAAQTYMRKKKMGPYAKDPAAEDFTKFLHRMAYAGFSYDVAKECFDARVKT